MPLRPPKPDSFYTSAEWRELRLFVLRRDRWRCVMCSAPVHFRGMARVDHIKTRKEAPELAMSASNLRTLCPRCDNQRHAEKGRRPGSVDPGANLRGQPLDPRHWWNKDN